MAEYKDRVKDQTNTTGTGTVTIDGVAATGYRTIASAHTTGATVRYTIVNSSGTEWETGQGVWTSSGATLTRATVYASSNSGSLVNFSSGAKTVFTGPVAQDLTEALSTLGGTMTGDLTFSGNGRRILADFTSNATIGNRLMFQSSTTNGNSLISVIPNGTATQARWIAYNSSDPANASAGVLSALSTDIRLASTNTGTGTLLPLTFFMGGTTEVARISTGNNFLIGTATDDTINKLQVSGNIKGSKIAVGDSTTPTGSWIWDGAGSLVDIYSSSGSTAAEVAVRSGTVVGGMYAQGSDGEWGLYGSTSADLSLFQNGFRRLRINASGATFLQPLTADSFSGAGTGLTGTASSLTAGIAQEVAGGAANQILYQTAANTTSYITAPTTGSTYLQWNGSAFVWAAVSGGSGTVTSVDVSGGTTGLSFSGGPVTSSGTITLAGTLAIANGGTGQTTKLAAFDALSPLTTLGDLIYHDGADNVRLAGNTTTSKRFLVQTGTGTVSAAPSWSAIALSDLGTGTPSASNYLRGDGTWATIGGGSPGGANTQVQYNNSGAFAGSANFTFDGTTVTGNQMADSGGNLRAMVLNSKAGGYTFIASDRGKLVPNTTGGWTVNASVFSSGDAVTVWNNSNAAQSIFVGASVTMYLAGTATTGTRTLAQRGIATIVCIFGGATPTFVVSGSGLT